MASLQDTIIAELLPTLENAVLKAVLANPLNLGPFNLNIGKFAIVVGPIPIKVANAPQNAAPAPGAAVPPRAV